MVPPVRIRTWETRFTSWMSRRLQTLAVYCCAATYSAEPGFAIDGGFALGERKAGDRNLLIRVNMHTTMTDHG